MGVQAMLAGMARAQIKQEVDAGVRPWKVPDGTVTYMHLPFCKCGFKRLGFPGEVCAACRGAIHMYEEIR
jgi:hypothetical protein